MATKVPKRPQAKETKVVNIPTKIVIKEVDVDHLFSEISHFKFLRHSQVGGEPAMTFMHLETQDEVTLDHRYVAENLLTADQYHKEVIVGKEDKLWTQKQINEAAADTDAVGIAFPRVGDVRVKGIRSIWEELGTAHVFAVCYETQGRELSESAYEGLKNNQIALALERIEKAKKNKDGVAKAAEQVLREVQLNPVNRWEKGEDRVLRGYKIQFTSRDGRYNCVDVDIKDAHNIRPVNINTIKWLVYNGVRYVVE